MIVKLTEAKSRFTRTVRAEVSDVEDLTDRVTGHVHRITHLTITWTWSDTHQMRDVNYTTRRVLKSGELGQNATKHHVFDREVPEWVEEFAATQVPAEYLTSQRINKGRS